MTMTREEVRSRQNEIIAALGGQPEIDVQEEIEKRVNFLIQKLVESGKTSFVLGESGGVDSCVVGFLAKIACDRLNEDTNSNDYKFIAMRLPYGVQRDEADAMAVIEAIQPHIVEVHNIKPSVDAIVAEEEQQGRIVTDYNKGNIKARIRMVVQYNSAAHHNGLVLSTDHKSEALTGFFTKFGDGAADKAPISTLSKRQVYALAKALGAPEFILSKEPTADLLDNNPGQADEFELGITYEMNSDFVEGKEVPLDIAERIINQYDKTQHKRDPIETI